MLGNLRVRPFYATERTRSSCHSRSQICRKRFRALEVFHLTSRSNSVLLCSQNSLERGESTQPTYVRGGPWILGACKRLLLLSGLSYRLVLHGPVRSLQPPLFPARENCCRDRFRVCCIMVITRALFPCNSGVIDPQLTEIWVENLDLQAYSKLLQGDS